MGIRLGHVAWVAATTVIVGITVNWAPGAVGSEQLQVAQSAVTETIGQPAPNISPGAVTPYMCVSECNIGAVFSNHGSR